MTTEQNAPGHSWLKGPVCLLVSWREEGRWLLLQELRASGLDVRILQPLLLGGNAPRSIKRLSVKLSRFYLPLFALLLHWRAAIWLTWNTPTGAVLGLLRRLLGSWLPPLMVRDFHVDPSWERDAGFKMRLLHMAAPGMDFVLTTSRAEEALYAQQFGFKRQRIRFLPESPASELLELPPCSPEDYVFAFGNSDRDFDTLVAAARELQRPVVILSQRYELPADAPANVRLMRDFVSQEELCSLICRAFCCVLPLKDYNVAAGQNVMLEVMTLQRPLIVSDNIATREYGEHGETVYFFTIGDAADLLQQLRRVEDAPDYALAMAALGRHRVEELAQRELATLLEAIHVTARRG